MSFTAIKKYLDGVANRNAFKVEALVMGTETAGKVVVVTAALYQFEAKMEVEYEWSPSGNILYMSTKRYWATNNGLSRGNIKMGLASENAGNTNWVELNNDNGIQDGQWHAFVKHLTVDANSRSATIYFNWQYDVDGRPDPNMTGHVDVTFP
ncbi:hypothetical protein [Pseudomonas sp. Q11]|uniref:hypothetical protein n=1 Tax=Pseudomonas sp. Q11 TaxID=2968470 RepID=UPI00210B3A08|nr:hypothetical protein [Pseudomonas sp. Q11]MCQ6256978.1 hypothetical protein [Pseudomonas sp. Q11]